MAVVSTQETLERAVRHVSEGWVPPQSEVLERIQQRFQAGDYDENRSALTQDLKEDFSLYMYCLRELSQMVEKEKESNQKHNHTGEQESRHTPQQLFENAELDDLRNVFAQSKSEISKHSFKEINEFQALRFRESMISATTAEVLAESVEVDPQVGFSCGLLRQLGLCLVAWNYPRVYARAVESLKPNTNLDAALRRVLGFSPSLLGITFARRWNLPEELLTALGDRRSNNNNSNLGRKTAFGREKNSPHLAAENLGETLSKICEVGEAFARANDPNHYPSALHDWETAQSVIAEYLGSDGISVIYERAQENLKHYASHTPELVDLSEASVAKEHIADSQFCSRLMEKNPHIRQLPDNVRYQIKELYSKLRPNKILKSNIRYLVDEVIPNSGFKCGCVYMYDPERKVLAPAIKIGEISPERLRPVKLSSVLAHFDLVASAYSLKTPLREETTSEDGGRISIIASSLGRSTPVGVLYVETQADFGKKYSIDPLQIFRAIRHCFQDCLNLL